MHVAALHGPGYHSNIPHPNFTTLHLADLKAEVFSTHISLMKTLMGEKVITWLPVRIGDGCEVTQVRAAASVASELVALIPADTVGMAAEEALKDDESRVGREELEQEGGKPSKVAGNRIVFGLWVSCFSFF